MGESDMYLQLIRKDAFLCAMLASYENAVSSAMGLRVLDYGCGYGWGSYIISGSCRQITGYDPDISRIVFARSVFGRENIAFVSDETLLAGERFDLVLLFMVLPYADNIENLLGKCGDYLKPGGMVRLSCKSTVYVFDSVFDKWAAVCGFTLVRGCSRYLSDEESVEERYYCKNRDEGPVYAL